MLNEGRPLFVRTPMEFGGVSRMGECLFEGNDSRTKIVTVDAVRIIRGNRAADSGHCEIG